MTENYMLKWDSMWVLYCVVSSGIDGIKNLVGDSMDNIENLVDYYMNLIKSCGDTGRSDGIQNQHWLQKLL